MERWCEGYCMEEGKACVFPKHVGTFFCCASSIDHKHRPKSGMHKGYEREGMEKRE